LKLSVINEAKYTEEKIEKKREGKNRNKVTFVSLIICELNDDKLR